MAVISESALNQFRGVQQTAVEAAASSAASPLGFQWLTLLTQLDTLIGCIDEPKGSMGKETDPT